MDKIYAITQGWHLKYGPDCEACEDNIVVGIFKSLEDAKKALENIPLDAKERINEMKGEDIVNFGVFTRIYDIKCDDGNCLSFSIDWKDYYEEYTYRIKEVEIGVFSDVYIFKNGG